jgi:ribosomal protein S18 acetylase RimI-like enzyme
MAAKATREQTGAVRIARIRRFRISDYDNLIALWKEAGLPHRPIGRDSCENIKREIKFGKGIFIVAEADGKLVGSCLGTHDGRKGWLNRVAVALGYRRKGVARRMVLEVEKRFSRLGLDITACLIEDWNRASMKVFEKLGYVKHPDFIYYSKRRGKSV